MLSSMTIERFRGFRKLQVDGLSRVNLFVGANNAGKTSILDAVELVAMGTVRGLLRSPNRRGEQILAPSEESRPPRPIRPEIDISHLFLGHTLRAGAFFAITATPGKSVRCEVAEATIGERNGTHQTLPKLEETLEAALEIRFETHLTPEPIWLRISPDGGVLERYYQPQETSNPVNFLGTEGVRPSQLGRLWDTIVLTPEEEATTAALQIIEPRIERIAFLGQSRVAPNIFVKLAGSEQRLPLGSVGDGLKRLLALALHLHSARDGILLVDEIDTGLHHSVMADMWRLVIHSARRIDAQVFATTHSLDCVRALAWVQQSDPEAASDVTLHRVEKDSEKTICYTVDELSIAAEHHLEVR